MSQHTVTGNLTVIVKHGPTDALQIQALIQKRLENIRRDLKNMGLINSSILVVTQPVEGKEKNRDRKN